MKTIFSLISLTLIMIVVGVAVYNDGRYSIMTLIDDQQDASELVYQLGKGNDEALYELEDRAHQGNLSYVLSLAAYNSTQGDYKSRDKAILRELRHANSLESLFILQEFAYLYDNHELSSLLGEMMDESGRIPPYVYNGVVKTSLTSEQLRTLAQCHQRLSRVYGNPANFNWNHFVQNGWENILGREGVCFSFVPKKSMNTLTSLH